MTNYLTYQKLLISYYYFSYEYAVQFWYLHSSVVKPQDSVSQLIKLMYWDFKSYHLFPLYRSLHICSNICWYRLLDDIFDIQVFQCGVVCCCCQVSYLTASLHNNYKLLQSLSSISVYSILIIIPCCTPSTASSSAYQFKVDWAV